jgi:hypothetical protein
MKKLGHGNLPYWNAWDNIPDAIWENINTTRKPKVFIRISQACVWNHHGYLKVYVVWWILASTIHRVSAISTECLSCHFSKMVNCRLGEWSGLLNWEHRRALSRSSSFPSLMDDLWLFIRFRKLEVWPTYWFTEEQRVHVTAYTTNWLSQSAGDCKRRW